MSKKVTSHESRVTRKACYLFFDESRDFIANHFKRPATRDPRPATSRGFSLLELMVVVVIIGIMLGVGIPKFVNHQKRTSVKLATRSAVSVMRLARSRAVAERTYYLGVFDSDPDSNGRCHIWVQKDETYSSKDPVSGTEKVLPKGVVIDSSTTGGGGGPIYCYVFTSKGTMQVGNTGTINLRDASSHTKYSVHMAPATGDIHMENSW